MEPHLKEIKRFLEGWKENKKGNKKGFEQLLSFLQSLDGCLIEFHPRKGVTYSLRGLRELNGDNKLFVMVDVIEDEPRWLSVCFYGKMINDPEEKGAFVPGGLLGEDAVCFDLEEYDEVLVEYVEKRIEEANKSVES